MTRSTCALLGALFASALLGASCREQARPTALARPAASLTTTSRAPSTRGPAGPGTLPEDPAAGARAVAEWRRHLEREERERRLAYDKRRLTEHRDVLATLRAARKAYDRASTEHDVTAAERSFRATRPKLERAFDALDHWGVSSRLLPDYRKLVDTFGDAYPSARIAALAGNTTRFERLGREVDAELAGLHAWLREAAESEED